LRSKAARRLASDASRPLSGDVAADENLLEVRLHRRRRRAHQAIVGGQVPPAEERLPLLLDDLLHQRFDRGARRGVPRHEDRANAVFAFRRQRHAEPLRFLAEKLVGNLDQDAGAVAGVDLAAARAAVQQVDEHLERLADDGVRAHALDVDDKADAAGVAFERRVIEALRRRAAGVAIHREK
jgi:hypothetical protein